ncbi:hypothetical protein MWU59_02130 [Flavobacteriaceae bacterium F08102]|nr:hypothetical protein [Flavobacteriaceae bacterium F08102]
MEPTKFEEYIRNQLNRREIEPRKSSWEEINSQLRQKKGLKKLNRKTVLYWVAVAAVVLLIINLGFKFNGINEITSPSIELVNTPQNKNDTQEKAFGKTEVVPKTPRVIALKKKKNTLTTPSVKDETKLEKSIRNAKSSSHKMIAIHKSQDSLGSSSQALINQKIIDVLAKVQELEKNNSNLTDLEVDSLLRKAQNEILAQQYNRLQQPIDAMALLDEVEYEINGTIKNKLFEALKKGFREVRTAVAERNK